MIAEAAETSTRPFWFPVCSEALRVPWVLQLMSRTFDVQEPPFLQAWYGDRYRDFAVNGEWLASSFIANAHKEAEGARKLATIASQARHLPFALAVAAHAEDEARHARMYLAMLKLVFPEALTDTDRHGLLADFPGPNFAEIDENLPMRTYAEILDDIVQMNIGEVRTRLHQMLLRPVAMIVCPAGNRHSLDELLNRILEDEGRHILYTADILENAAKSGDAGLIEQLYRKRTMEFSELTLREVGVGEFD